MDARPVHADGLPFRGKWDRRRISTVIAPASEGKSLADPSSP
jgi:hypothetical protein